MIYLTNMNDIQFFKVSLFYHLKMFLIASKSNIFYFSSNLNFFLLRLVLGYNHLLLLLLELGKNRIFELFFMICSIFKLLKHKIWFNH